MVIIYFLINQMYHVSFKPHAFSQSGNPFGRCGNFSQAEPFEKPWFLECIVKFNGFDSTIT